MKPGNDTPRLIRSGSVCSNTMPTPTTDGPPHSEMPTRGADRNDSLAEETDNHVDELFLPSLDPGLTLLDIEGGRGVPVLQSLVLDHLLMTPGPVFWIDTHGYATTTSLARLAPTRRQLEKIHVARGFTAYQHYSMCCDLPSAVAREIQCASRRFPNRNDGRNVDSDDSRVTPVLLVVPVLDAHYREEDTLPDEHGQTLQARVLARLQRYAEGYDVPVLITRSDVDAFTDSIEHATEYHLRCELTSMGPKFEGENFETLLFPREGDMYQTTWAYWQEILQRRAEQVDLQVSPRSSLLGDPSTTASPNPLLDTWDAETGGG